MNGKTNNAPEGSVRHKSGVRAVYVRLFFGVVIVAVVTGFYWFMSEEGVLTLFRSPEALQEHIAGFGILGPITVILLMTAAIVFSPVPSAPIALAAGAVFGHSWGTIYVLLGAESGAIIAFSIARMLGYDVLHRWFGKRLSMNLLGDQNALTTIVFLSRLIPFISFDVVSYAAGLTSLSFWRFAVATMAGIIPASFLLAHFGSQVTAAEAESGLITVLLLGGITLLPVLFRVLQKRYSGFGKGK